VCGSGVSSSLDTTRVRVCVSQPPPPPQKNQGTRRVLVVKNILKVLIILFQSSKTFDVDVESLHCVMAYTLKIRVGLEIGFSDR
jgi:hypothetical protein